MNSLIIALTLVSSVLAENWATYPAVPKTASINGFADPLKAFFPSCAEDCADIPTSNTPCPYWDTGCLCVMPQFSGLVADCIAQSCSGQDVALATALAVALCSQVGANLWMMPASISTELSEAADGYAMTIDPNSSAFSWGTIETTTGLTSSGSKSTKSASGSSLSLAKSSSSGKSSSASKTSSSSKSAGSSSAKSTSTASETSAAASSGSGSSSANGAAQVQAGSFGVMLMVVLSLF